MFYHNLFSYSLITRKDKEKNLLPNNNSDNSLASYIKLKFYYRTLREKGRKSTGKHKVWLRFRKKILTQMNKKGHLECFYCTKDKLSRNFNNPNIWGYKGRATLDHYIPVATTKNRFQEENIVCACYDCNNRKQDMSANEFYNKYKNIINFNDNFIKKMENKND